MSAPSLVMHVVHRFAVGGLENGLVNLVNRLPAERWRHLIVSLTGIDAGFATRISRGDVEIVALGKGPGHAVPVYSSLWRLIRSHRPAIYHTRNLAALETQPVAWLAGVPARIHGEHGRDQFDPDGRNVRRRRIRRVFRPFVHRYIALSPDLADYLAGPIGVPPDRIEQIYNGVDTTRFAPVAARTPIAGCPFGAAGEFIVGTVGRLDPVKDQVTLVRAFALVLERSPALRERLRLVVVGEGEERGRLEAALRETGVASHAWLAGERGEIEALLRGFDLFVLPSRGEGVSNTILEAMASGLPVVATRVGANAELCIEGATAALVPPGDPDALAHAIARYAGDTALARIHGGAARARAEQRFSLDRMIERYDRLYASLRSPLAGRDDALSPASGPGSHARH